MLNISKLMPPTTIKTQRLPIPLFFVVCLLLAGCNNANTTQVTLEERVSQLEAQNEDLTSRIDELESRTDDLESAKDDLDSRVSELEY